MTVQFVTNCSLYDSDGERSPDCLASRLVTTDEYSFAGVDYNETASVNFTGEDIGNITHLVMQTASSDEWCIGSLTVLLEDNAVNKKWVECDLTFFANGVVMDYDCSGSSPYYGGYKIYTLRVDEYAPYCTLYYTNTSAPTKRPSSMPTIVPTSVPSGAPSMPTNVPSKQPSAQPSYLPTTLPTAAPTDQRTYSATFHTADYALCETSDTPEFSFANGQGTSTDTKSLTPNGQNQNTTKSWTASDIGTISTVTFGQSSGENSGWCMDYFLFDLNNGGDSSLPHSRGCSFAYQSFQFLDRDCGTDFGARNQYVLDVSASSPLCWDIYNDSSLSGHDYRLDWPSYQSANDGGKTAANATGNRTYMATFSTASNAYGNGDCGSSGTMTMQFVTNCSLYDSDGERSPDCLASRLTSTDEYSFNGVDYNETASVNFSGEDIGNITHLVMQTTSSDEWCIGSLTVLLEDNDFAQKWVECDLTFFANGVVMDYDCSGSSPYYGGYKYYTLRVDEYAPYCTVYYTNTLAPTEGPSSMPTIVPTAVPSVFPTYVAPSSSPTDGFEYFSVNGIDYQVISESDIKFDGEVTTSSTTGNGDSFNAGYRMEFSSLIEIDLNTREKVALFEKWDILERNENITFSMKVNVEWMVYDISNNGMYVNVSSDDIFQYDETALTMNHDKSNGTYWITSEWILFYDKDVANAFSSQICLNDEGSSSQEYFDFGSWYSFVNEIEFELTYESTNYSVDNSNSIGLATNSPIGGNVSCHVLPGDTGDVLIDTFNFSCHRNGDNDNLTVNFLYDDQIFLNDEYSNLSETWIATYLPNGDHTVSAVILDELSLPTCVDLDVTVHINLTEFEEYKIGSFSTWLVDKFDELVTNVTVISKSGEGDDDDGSTRRLRSLLATSVDMSTLAISEEIVISLLTTFVEENNISATNEHITSAYEGILSSYLNHVEASALTAADTQIYLNSISSFTKIIVGNDSDTGTTTPVTTDSGGSAAQSTVTYSASVITALLDSLTDSVGALLDSYNSSQALEAETAELILDVVSNVITMRRASDEGSRDAASNGQAVVDLVIDVANAFLIGKYPGEFVQYSTDELIFKAAKISSDVTGECGLGNVRLSDQLLARRSRNGSDYMDCAIMLVYDDLYTSAAAEANKTNSTYNGNTWQTPFFLLNVENENGDDSSSLSTTGEYSTTGSDDSNYTNGYLSECEPILIELNSTNTSWWDAHYPTCSYYNETSQEYLTDGCYVLYSSDDVTTCACLHTTMFGVTWEDFSPEINFIASDIYHELTFANLWNYPLGWVIVLSWISVCFSLIMVFYCCKGCEPNLIEDTPLIAQEKALLDKLVDHHNSDDTTRTHKVNREYQIIQELNIVKDPNIARRSLICKVFYIWKIKMKTDHIWFGICFRSAGTSYTLFERIGVMMIRLLTTMAVSALFYGQSKDSTIGDLSLTMYESLLGFLPMYVIQRLIKEHRPRGQDVEEHGKKQEMVKQLREQQSEINNTIVKGITLTNGDGVLLGLGDPLGIRNKVTASASTDSNQVETAGNGKDTGNFASKSSNMSPASASPDPNSEDDDDVAGQGGQDSNILEMVPATKTRDKKRQKDSKNDDGETDEEESVLKMKLKEHSEVLRSRSVSTGMEAHSSAEVAKEQNKKWQEILQLKEEIIEKEYFCPHWCRYVANTVVVLWTFLCAIITSLWCIYFDVVLNARNEYDVESSCVDYDVDFDISEQDWMNYNATQDYIANLTSQYYTPYSPPEGDSFGEDIVTSDRFLYAVLTSYLIAVFVWQPLTMFALSMWRYRKITRMMVQVHALQSAALTHGKSSTTAESSQDSGKSNGSESNGNGNGNGKVKLKKKHVNQLLLFAADLNVIEWQHDNAGKQNESGQKGHSKKVSIDILTYENTKTHGKEHE